MTEKSTSRQMTVNLIASIVSFAVNIGINFFLTPYLVKSLGSEAYGFIGLANNFVQYANLITVALNSISGRFISIEYHRGNIDKASRIFSSVLVADLFMAAALLVASCFTVGYIDAFLDIPAELVTNVKITFAITFATFIVSVVTAIFTTAAFVKNRLDINSIRDIISNLIKVCVVVSLFVFFPPELYFLSIAMLVSGLFLLIANITVKKKILPDVKVKLSNFSFGLVKTLFMAGIWLSLSQLSGILMTGLDLLMCNITLGAAVMGLLSIGKTVPTALGNLIITIGNVFTPHFTIKYAKNDIKGLVAETKFSGKIMNLIMVVPLAGFIAFGNQFYTLWQPTKSPEEITMIQIISIFTCLTYLFSCITQCHMMLFTVCNKLIIPVLTNLAIGLVSVVSVFLTLKFGNLGSNGVYVIAAVSSVLLSIRSITFVPMYAAHILKQKLTVFMAPVFRGILTFGIIFGIFKGASLFLPLYSWMTLIASCLGVGIVGYILSVPLLFNRQELVRLKGILFKKLKRG